MELAKAQAIAQEIKAQLQPYCLRIEIAGSIRRQRSEVKDIDLVIIPKQATLLVERLMRSLGVPTLAGNKLMRFQMPEICVDIYMGTFDTWATLLLIRTGSAAHNIKLAKRARSKGLKLHADGTGITKKGERIAGDTEESIFEALDLPYILPEHREA